MIVFVEMNIIKKVIRVRTNLIYFFCCGFFHMLGVGLWILMQSYDTFDKRSNSIPHKVVEECGPIAMMLSD